MKRKILILSVAILCCTCRLFGQWAVIDPSNIATSIINSTNQIVQTSSTAATMLKNFDETVKIYQQGKQYYDGLKAVNNLVKDARKVQQTILMVGEISDIYVNNFQKMLSDPNYSVEELSAIAMGYAKLLEESSALVSELRTVTTITSLSMSDKERMDVVEQVYSQMKEYKSLVQYFTNKNIAVSYLRAKKKNDTERVIALYGNPNEKYW
jgi:hypothetical protein